ncbi:MAG: glycosyltransferase, partial [Gammaproteobacteria bacterium]|nr:glycosyltransferase [Gammaproteobacteria bacterium]
LFALDFNPDRLEIILVDNGSTDGSLDIMERSPATVLSEATPGAAAARNRGVAAAHGDLIAFTDADCIVSPNWAREIERGFRYSGVDALMGFSEGANDGYWAALEQANFESFWYRRDGDELVLRRPGIDTRNCAVRRSTLALCGGFDVRLSDCEDLELGIRLRRGGHAIALNDRMRVRHHNRTALRQILAIKARHGRAFAGVVAREPDGFDSVHLPGDFRYYLGLDNRRIEASGRGAALLYLGLLRRMLFAASASLRGLAFPPQGLALKVFKTLCGVVWEIELIKEMGRLATQRPDPGAG